MNKLIIKQKKNKSITQKNFDKFIAQPQIHNNYWGKI